MKFCIISITESPTAWKVSRWNTEFFLFRISPHSDWIWRDTEYLSTLETQCPDRHANIYLLKVAIKTLEKVWNMFKVNNKDTRTVNECSYVFIVNFEHISQLFLVFLLLTLKRQMFAQICSIGSKHKLENTQRTLICCSVLIWADFSSK